MDVTLGVVVRGQRAMISLLDAQQPHAVVDESGIDLTDRPDELVSTLVATDRQLTEAGHRLVATSVCGADADAITALSNALIDADLMNVSVVSQSDAVTAVTRALVDDRVTASLVSDGETAALSIIDGDADATSLIAVEPVTDGDNTGAFRRLLERFAEEPGGAASVIVLGGALAAADTAALAETSPVPVQIAENPEFAVARGVALAGRQRPLSAGGGMPPVAPESAATMMAPAEPQLAYSEVDEFGTETGGMSLAGPASGGQIPMPMRPLPDIDPDELDAVDPGVDQGRPRVLLLGSAVAAVVVVGFAALAVSVAIGIRPVVSEQAIRMNEEAVPGKYFPVSPGQGVLPSGPAWTVNEQNLESGVASPVREFESKLLGAPRASDSAAQIFKLNPDNTIGVEPAVNRLAQEGSNIAAGAVGPAAGAEAPEYLTRLIPDFSRFTPTDVFSVLANAPYLGDNLVKGASAMGILGQNLSGSGLTGTASSAASGLGDLGLVTLVPRGTGSLFSAATDTASAVGNTVANGIPTEVFSLPASELNDSGVLPAGVKVVEEVTTGADGLATETKPATGMLGGIFTPQDGALTEVSGTGLKALQQAAVQEGRSTTTTAGTTPVTEGGTSTAPMDSGLIPPTDPVSKSIVIPGTDTKATTPSGDTPDPLSKIQPGTTVIETKEVPTGTGVISDPGPLTAGTPDAGEVPAGTPNIEVPDGAPIVEDAPKRRGGLLGGIFDSPKKAPEPAPDVVQPPAPEVIPEPKQVIPEPKQVIPEPVYTPPEPVYTEPEPVYVPPPVVDPPAAPSKPIIDIPFFKPPSSPSSGGSDSGSSSSDSSDSVIPTTSAPRLPFGGLFGSGS